MTSRNELAIALAAPPGLVVQRTDADGAFTLRVRRRWPALALAAMAVPFGAISLLPVPLALGLAAGMLAVWSTGVLDVTPVGLDQQGVRCGAMTVPYADIERCEVRGRLRARLSLTLRSGRQVRVFAGSRRQARWLAQMIEGAVAAGGVVSPLPSARLLPAPAR